MSFKFHQNKRKCCRICCQCYRDRRLRSRKQRFLGKPQPVYEVYDPPLIFHRDVPWYLYDSRLPPLWNTVRFMSTCSHSRWVQLINQSIAISRTKAMGRFFDTRFAYKGTRLVIGYTILLQSQLPELGLIVPNSHKLTWVRFESGFQPISYFLSSLILFFFEVIELWIVK